MSRISKTKININFLHQSYFINEEGNSMNPKTKQFPPKLTIPFLKFLRNKLPNALTFMSFIKFQYDYYETGGRMSILVKNNTKWF